MHGSETQGRLGTMPWNGSWTHALADFGGWFCLACRIGRQNDGLCECQNAWIAAIFGK